MDGFCGLRIGRVGRTDARVGPSRVVPLNSPYSHFSRSSGGRLQRVSHGPSQFHPHQTVRPRASDFFGGLGSPWARPLRSVALRHRRGHLRQMAVQKEFLSEVEPAVFVPTLGYIAILELETEKDPVVIVPEPSSSTARRKPCLPRARLRLRQMPEGEVRRLRSATSPNGPRRCGARQHSETFRSSRKPAAKRPPIRTRLPAYSERSPVSSRLSSRSRTVCSP